jgi:predicted lipid-binding transport protein (Tim44 family)
MGKWLLASLVIAFSGIFIATDAEARRFGGARNLGAQRNVTAPPAQTPARPAQQQAGQGQQGAQQAAPNAGASRWGGILGGLAIGGLLGYLFAGNGLMGLLVLALLAFGAVALVRALMRRQQSAPLQYAGMRETAQVPAQSFPAQSSVPQARVPAGFDASGFLRAAKVNFLRLQAANDAGELDEIREFTTDELYEALKADARGGQRTEIVGLDAELLELAKEGEQHWASVRFSGTEREAPGAEPQAFAEVWNLAKPADGSSGWLLAGIQQTH